MTAVSMIVPIRVLLALDYAVDTDWKAITADYYLKMLYLFIKQMYRYSELNVKNDIVLKRQRCMSAKL
jgi:hypothetical protein